MKLIEDLGTLYAKETSKRKERFGIYECPICFEPFKTRTATVNNGTSTKCRSCATSLKNEKHGESRTDLYRKWSGMLGRCKNSEHYKSKGITICYEWLESYNMFKEWALDNGYEEGLSLDRIDGKGNYEPSNCRWVTLCVQSQNTSLSSRNTSGYRGVSYSERDKKFVSKIHHNGKSISLGNYDSRLDAAKAYNKYVEDNNTEHTKNSLEGEL